MFKNLFKLEDSHDFNYLFKSFLNNINGFESSFEAKKVYSGIEDVKKMVYGEVTAKSCSDIINILTKYCNLDKTEKILDLGSGIGKFVIAMHYSDLFKQVDGCEILDKMANDSKEIINLYLKQFNKNISNLNIYNENILNIDFSSYDVLFSNTSINKDLVNGLIKKISEEAKKRCIIITTITPFESSNVKLIESFNSKFSWGSSHLNFSIKM